MIDVEITNYQSIAHAKFVIDGFTTIVGRNYLGKSAVLRAVNAALTNQHGTDFIRWGQTFCEVRIKTGDLDILWHKEDNNNFYKINGKDPLTKIGKSEPPKEIVEAGFKQLKIGDQKINLNYANQFNELFLVDKMDSKGADLLTSVYGLDRLYKAIDLCSKEQRDNRDELKLREKDLEIVNRDLERFRDFDKIKESADAVQGTKKSIDRSEKELIDLKDKYVKIHELATVCKRLASVKDISVPDDKKILNEIAAYHRLVQYSDSVTTLTGATDRLHPILKTEVPVSREISTAIEDYQKLVVLYDKYQALSKEIDRLSKIEEISIPEPDIDVDTISKLRGIYDEAMRQKKELLGFDKELKDLSGAIEDVQKLLDKYDVCPLCGKSRK